MSKNCAKCSKTVYPLEELKCLDKIWHKGCFKCTECGMALNMKTYKGFNKSPYCEAHIPKAKATTVADTPEMKRIQENTKIQSNAAYHAEFEKSKGKFTAVTDDPELLRLKGNTKIISNVTYHGDLEKKAVMETKRILTSGDGGDLNTNGASSSQSTSPSYMAELASVPTAQRHGPISMTTAYPPQQSRPIDNYHHSGGGGDDRSFEPNHGYTNNVMSPPRHEQLIHQHQPPVPNNTSPYSTRGVANVVYASDGIPANSNSTRKVGSIVDYDPVNNYFGSLDSQRGVPQQVMGKVAGGGITGSKIQSPRRPLPTTNNSTSPYGVCYRALYDYEAQDMDEVSFLDGDIMINCSAVEEGWMTGTVRRTGRRGMLPANYVIPDN